MRIAVFDHQLNHGGGKRFLFNLLCALADVDPSIRLTLFCDAEHAAASYDFKEFVKRNIRVQQLQSLQLASPAQHRLHRRAIRYLVRKVETRLYKQRDEKEKLHDEIIELSKGFDIAYFPWPYLLKSPKTACPKVATFHDFNFRYFFGTLVYNNEQIELLNKSIHDWMQDTFPVVSTHFMERELRKFYPQAAAVRVIHLASLNMYRNDDLLPDNLFAYPNLLNEPYILFPVHITAHKNIGNVISATSRVNNDGRRFRLVLTGKNTEMIKGKSSYLGLENSDLEEGDVQGLGYVDDKQMHYLQQKAFAVLNASLYEAGNGVGLDAWPMGTPVLQSNIPAFEEHLQLQGLQAFTFDPKDVSSITEAIEECLGNSDKRAGFVNQSLIASKKMTWHTTAIHYLELFTSLLQKGNDEN
jgi:glycosyltransferase involved in cell wall biosynthesis